MKKATYAIMFTLTLAPLLATAFTLLASYCPMTEFFSKFSVLVVFFPYLFLLDFLLFAYWFLNRKALPSVLTLLILLAGTPSMLKVFSLSPPFESDESNESIRLLSCNVKLFGFSAEQAGRCLAYVSAVDADVVCLQEFGFYADGLLNLHSIRKQLSAYPYMHLSRGTGRPSGIQKHTVTFSKYPIVKTEEIDLGSRYHCALVSTIVRGGDSLRVVNCYLESNKLSESDKKLFDDVDGSLHNIAGKLAVAAVRRNAQADTIRSVLPPGSRGVIICGDLNDVPNSRSYRTMSEDMNDAFLCLRRGMGFTFHEGIYNYRIDYVLASKDIRLLNFVLDRQDISDHYPIITEFALNDSINQQTNKHL